MTEALSELFTWSVFKEVLLRSEASAIAALIGFTAGFMFKALLSRLWSVRMHIGFCFLEHDPAHPGTQRFTSYPIEVKQADELLSRYSAYVLKKTVGRSQEEGLMLFESEHLAYILSDLKARIRVMFRDGGAGESMHDEGMKRGDYFISIFRSKLKRGYEIEVLLVPVHDLPAIAADEALYRKKCASQERDMEREMLLRRLRHAVAMQCPQKDTSHAHHHHVDTITLYR